MNRGTGYGLLVIGLWLVAAGCKMMSETIQPGKVDRHPVDFQEALRFAERANAAYLTPAEIRARYDGRRVVAEEVPASEVQFFIVIDEEDGVQDISVRGTSNLENIRVDARIAPVLDAKLGVHLHRGFATSGAAVYGRILPHLNRAFRTTVTGHSLGGALAALIGAYLVKDGFEVRRILTFGQPRITNLEGAKKGGYLPLLRFVNRGDPVADMPPLVTIHDRKWVYSHFGSEVILWTGNRYAFLEKHQVLDKALVSFWANLGEHSVKEHQMASYVAALKKRVEKAEEIRYEDRRQFLEDR